VIGILGGLAFAFATYNPIIISVGHESKMWAIAFIPLLMAGLFALFEKKYWLGLALTTFGIYQQIGVNHFQITYYAIFIAAAISICYLVKFIKEKDWKHIVITAGLVLVAAVIGVAGNALILKTTSEYAAYTIRGGKEIEVKGDTITKVNKKGLDPDYAFEYSLGKAEVTTLLMPGAFGSSSGELLDEDSKVVDKLADRGVPEANAMQLASRLPKYWGGIDGAAGTAGPPYLGVITCLLALIGFVLYKHPLRWGLLAVSVLSVLMAYGKYLSGFNGFLFENLPLYNKFRAPTMALTITQFTMTLMAVLSLQYILFRENSRELLKADFKNILIAVGSLLGLLLVLYIGMDYGSPFDKQIMNYQFDESGSNELNKLIISGMKADRKAMFIGQVARTFGFAVLLIGLLYLFIRNTLKPVVVVILLTLISTIDLFATGKKYLDEEAYVPADTLMTEFTPSAADTEILKDTDPHFRVFNTVGNPFVDARTSYYHRSVGGYHPAKLRIYQDLIERHLSGNPNREVLNMLDTRYAIQQNPQTGEVMAVRNPDAYGPAWLVKGIRVAASQVEAIQALDNTNLKDTVIIEADAAKNIPAPQWDSTATIRLSKAGKDTLEYEINGTGPQFAVFSEVYYPAGWNAYLDGQKTEYLNVNYVLRGMPVPAGKHTVRFVFEPSSYKQGSSLMFISSILIAIVVLGGLFMTWRESQKTKGLKTG